MGQEVGVSRTKKGLLQEKDESKQVIFTQDKEHYKHADFPNTSRKATFYIIKSYCEDGMFIRA